MSTNNTSLLDTFHGFTEGLKGRDPEPNIQQDIAHNPDFAHGYEQGRAQYEQEQSLKELASLREHSKEQELDRDEPEYC